ncbi:MAG: VacB/RNase II family 3'-5' exoribonuclease, partial [Bacteroidales bacterium]|nr:VacB/RNase II family 3'-5' exoribonuclease [Bacteroidales bacterium]
FNYKQISNRLGFVEPSSRTLVNQILCELTKAGTLKEASRGKFKLKAKSGVVLGIVDVTKTGSAYVVCEDLSDDVYVSQKNLGSAFDGDTVKVSLYASRAKGRLEGEIVEIVQRARTQFVGTIRSAGAYSFMIPDNAKVLYDIFIPSDRLMGAKDGEKVIVEIEEWPSRRQNPVGRVVEVLGEVGDNETEMHAILAEFGLPSKFSEDIERQANKLKFEITDYDLKTREDFRDITTFTIDPADAKDFDDALSFQKLGNGHYSIGVHIADVSHYLHENTDLDEEAFNRATSVYLVDRTVPMLPEKLCNNLCSLRPNEEKFCFSVIFEMDEAAQVVDYRIVKTIISSDRRYAYEEAQEIIETGKGDFAEEILKLNELAKKLRSERFQKGSFNFEHKEVKFILDDDARPTGVYFKESKEANNLIEEFMLLANRKVAEFIGKQKRLPFVYRVHAEPNYEKLSNFSTFIGRFGYAIDMSSSISLSRSLNGLVSDVKGKPEQNIIENLAVRAMAKAVYSTKNIGHYGLSFNFYSHFTSPIRRYPDVMTH